MLVVKVAIAFVVWFLLVALFSTSTRDVPPRHVRFGFRAMLIAMTALAIAIGLIVMGEK